MGIPFCLLHRHSYEIKTAPGWVKGSRRNFTSSLCKKTKKTKIVRLMFPALSFRFQFTFVHCVKFPGVKSVFVLLCPYCCVTITRSCSFIRYPQHFGTLRSGSDSRSEGHHGSHYPPSPRWGNGPGRLRKIRRHDLRHWPSDKQGCFKTGTLQVRLIPRNVQYVVVKVRVCNTKYFIFIMVPPSLNHSF